MLATDFLGIAFQQGHVLGNRRGEWMMARVPSVLLFVETEQWKVHDPEKIETVCRNVELALAAKKLRAIKPNLAENLTGGQPLVGREEDEVAFLDLEPLGERSFLGIAKELHD